jgi:hypothetical protein
VPSKENPDMVGAGVPTAGSSTPVWSGASGVPPMVTGHTSAT